MPLALPIIRLSQTSKTSGPVDLASKVAQTIQKGEPILKFAYLGEGAFEWDKIRNKESFSIGGREVEALSLICQQIEPEFRTHQKSMNLIHLGSGNGIEIPTLLSLLRLSQKDSYNAVDVSENLIDLVIRDYSETLLASVGSCHCFLIDADETDHLAHVSQFIKKLHAAPNVIIAAGEGTLISDPKILKSISQAMDPEDLAVFSIDGCHPGEEKALCDQYDTPAVRDFLSCAIRFSEKAGVLSPNSHSQFVPTLYDSETQQIKVYYQVPDQKPILVLRSLKPQTEEQIIRFFKSSGLAVKYIVKTKDFSFGVACYRLQ